MGSLKLQFLPFEEVSKLSLDAKVERLLSIVKANKILLMQGRLTPEEEAKVIQKTMESITKKFRGIELCIVHPEFKESSIFDHARKFLVDKIAGNSQGITIIGPASIVKKIERDPEKIELLTKEIKRRS